MEVCKIRGGSYAVNQVVESVGEKRDRVALIPERKRNEGKRREGKQTERKRRGEKGMGWEK